MLRPRFIALLLLLGTLAVYLPASGYSYHAILKSVKIFLSGSNEKYPQPTGYGFSCYDDGDYVTDNPMVEKGLTWAGITWAFTTWHAANWHPLTWISHMADCQIFGLDAGMHHSINVLFHAANSILLLLLLLRWTNAPWSSAFAAALFAWHPLHVESVAWVSERKDVLSTFFALLTLLAYTKAAAKMTNVECRMESRRPAGHSSFAIRHSGYWLTLLFFALGLMAKPMLVTLPFVMLLLDYWPLNRIQSSEFGIRNFTKLLLEKWPFFALSAASCAVTFLCQHHGGAVATLENVPLDFRMKNVPVAYTSYLLKMFWPAHLAVFYPLKHPSILAVAAAVTALAAISWLAWGVRRSRPYWLVGWLWFLGTLVPVIGLVQVGGAAMADRYSYFPSIGVFLAVALGVLEGAERFQVSRPIIGTIASLALAACLVLTHRQLNFWQDDLALFGHAIAVTKNNDMAHLNLGFAFDKIGRKADAMAEYRTAMKIDPESVEAHNNLANLLDDTGHPDEAAAEYLAALRLNPKYAAAHNNYGTLLTELGRFTEAMEQYAAAAQSDPTDWHPPYLIGKALLKQGRDTEAISYFRQAVKTDPDNPQVLVYLAQVLASDKNPQVRDGNAALAMAAKANDLTGGNQPAMIDAMAMAYAEAGQFTNAQETAAYALKLATAYDMTNDVVLVRQRLLLYKNHQPFRQSFLFTNTPAHEPPKN